VRNSVCPSLAFLLLFTASTAVAQKTDGAGTADQASATDVEPAPDATLAADAAPAADAVPVSGTAPASQPGQQDAVAGEAPEPRQAEPASGRSACLIGLHLGFDPADARTATDLVCRELKEQGAFLGDAQEDAGGAASAYRVMLRKLGSYTMYIDVTYEEPIGRQIKRRSLRLNSIEEVVVAAPRMARSLMHGQPLEDTAEVDSLVGQETRKYDKIYGEFLFGLGVLGAFFPTAGIYAGWGFQVQGFYEAPEFSVGIGLEIGGANQNRNDAFFFGTTVGGRYFFNTLDISPYIGGGLGFLILRVDKDDDYDSYYGNGLAAKAEVGVEFLRFHSSRLDLNLRLIAPMYALDADSDYYPPRVYDPETDSYVSSSSTRPENKSLYVFPIMLGLCYAW
jgi:hypothetical protein